MRTEWPQDHQRAPRDSGQRLERLGGGNGREDDDAVENDSGKFCFIHSRAVFQWATRAVKRAVVLWAPQRRGGLDTIEASLR